MDQEWKKQNQLADPHAQSPQPPKTVPSAVAETVLPTATANPDQTLASQPISAPPDTLTGQTGTNVYDQYNPGIVPRRKIVVTVIVLALLAIPGGIGAYAFLGKKPPQKVDNQTPAVDTAKPQPNTTQPVIENKQPAVPISWKVVDTKLGYTVKIPAEWSTGLSSDFNLNGLKTRSVTLSDPKADTGTFISAGTQSHDGLKTQQEFENYLTSDQAYADLGLSKDQATLTSKKININGKEWLQIDAELSGQLSRTVYMWSDDHEISLAAVSNKQDSLDKLSSDYLFPIAASLQIK